jgi:hypothetical protein
VSILRMARDTIPHGLCAADYPEANPLIPMHLYDPQIRPGAKAVPVVLKRSVDDSANSRSAGVQP